MSDQFEIEPSHRVYDNDSNVGACIEVRVCPDIPGNLMLWTPDEESREYYGDFRLGMMPEQAKALRDAMSLQINSITSPLANGKFEIKPAYRVYDNDSNVGACIEVCLCPDNSDFLTLWTPNKESREYYGDFRLNVILDHAKTLRDSLSLQLKAMGVE